MKAYKIVSTLPSGKTVESWLFRSRRVADWLMSDKALNLMHVIVGATQEIRVVKVSLWKWLWL